MDRLFKNSSVPEHRLTRLHSVGERLARVARSLARPLAHGTAGLAAAAVVVSAVGLPADLPPGSAGPSPAQELADPQPEAVAIPARSEEIIDSGPVLASLLITEDAKALRPVDDIEAAHPVLTDTPQSSALADTTPDGGGRAHPALRPTVS